MCVIDDYLYYFIYTYCHRLPHLIKLLLCTDDCLDFLGSRRHRPHWIPFKGPDFRRGVLLISPGANEGHFEGKRPRKDHQVCLVLARQYPDSPVTCNPEDSGLLGILASWSPTLFSRSGPLGLPFVLWIKKKQLNLRRFSSDAEIIAVAETWLVGQPIWTCFWVAYKR